MLAELDGETGKRTGVQRPDRKPFDDNLARTIEPGYLTNHFGPKIFSRAGHGVNQFCKTMPKPGQDRFLEGMSPDGQGKT